MPKRPYTQLLTPGQVVSRIRDNFIAFQNLEEYEKYKKEKRAASQRLRRLAKAQEDETNKLMNSHNQELVPKDVDALLAKMPSATTENFQPGFEPEEKLQKALSSRTARRALHGYHKFAEEDPFGEKER